MIKRYNQFIKKTNESSIEPEVEELTSLSTDSIEDTNSNYSEEGVEDSLEYLHDTLKGSELMNNILKYQGHEITMPSEFEGSSNKFEVDGVRLASSEDVENYLKNPRAQAEAQAKIERRQQAQSRRSQVQNAGEKETPVKPGIQQEPTPTETPDERRKKKREERYNIPAPSIEQDPLAYKESLDTMSDNELDLDKLLNTEPKFKTETGLDPEEEALAGKKVDIDQIGKKVDIDQIGQKREAQFESKSYKSRFRTKL